ncbi:MAG: hypothetical protein NOF05_20140 [Candidatus Accumulibacter phosphatis]|nr:hypothetical protein [Candidatus Accumulibacter phosphatis]
MKQPNIARLEKKPGDPSLSTLRKPANVLGVDRGRASLRSSGRYPMHD